MTADGRRPLSQFTGPGLLFADVYLGGFGFVGWELKGLDQNKPDSTIKYLILLQICNHLSTLAVPVWLTI
jgi:hypothetical protein